MRNISLLLIPYIFMTCSLSFASDIMEVPKCEVATCFSVAKEIPLPALKSNKNSITIEFDNFKIPVPVPERISTSNSAIYLLYKDKQALVIGRDGIPDDILQGGKTSITPNLIPAMIYTKTTKDQEPTETIDKNVWRWALLQKSYSFNPKIPAQTTYSTHGDTSYYVFEGKDDRTGLTSAAFVSNMYSKSFYLYIHAKNIDKDIFRRVVYGTQYVK